MPFRLITVLSLLLVLLPGPLVADPQVMFHTRRDGKVSFLKVRSTRRSAALPLGNPEDRAQVFLRTHARTLGVNDPEAALTLVAAERDELGYSHLRYSQSKNGVPLYGGEVQVHCGADAEVRAASGRGGDLRNVETQPLITRAQAVEEAKAVWRQSRRGEPRRVRKTRLFLFNKALLHEQEGDETRLVWRVTLANRGGIQGGIFFVDARAGGIVQELDTHRSLTRQVWDCGANDGHCYLDQPKTIAGQLITLGRSEGRPERPLHPQWSEPRGNNTNLVYDYLGFANRYYLETYGRDGANNAGGLGDGTSLSLGLSLAYTYIDGWNGTDLECPNAMFGVSPPALQFCREFVSIDLLGHEYAHAVNYYGIRGSYNEPSGFIYSGQPGAIEEGYADVFGAAIEYFATGDAGDWLLFEDSSLGALRSLADPPAYGTDYGAIPDRWYSSSVYCGQGDYGGVHHNSGIVAKLGYLIAAGGTFNGCSLQGLGREKAEAVFYRALQYLSYNADFNDLYEGLLTACGDLYGDEECKQVNKAAYAVEIDQPGRCSRAARIDPAAMCANLDNPSLPPVITVSAPAGASRVGGAQRIVFTDSELTAPECSFNGRTWTSCTSGVTRLRQIKGWWRLRGDRSFPLLVRDTDSAGSTGLATVRRLRLTEALAQARMGRR